MTTRKVIITAKHNLESAEKLLQSSYVKKLWMLPNEHILMEFYHPAFELTRNPSFVTQWSDSTRQLAADAVQKERELLTPLYSLLQTPSDALMLLVPSRTATYEFIGTVKGKIRWPDLGCSPDWETAREIRIVAKLDHRSGDIVKRAKILETIFDEWLGAMSEFGLSNDVMRSQIVGSHFSKVVRFGDVGGDACMVFYMLVAALITKTGAECLGFFHPDDFDSPFLQIGGSRRTEQVRLES